MADRLLAVTAPGLAWSAGYDGDGVRRWQAVNGEPVTYTLDLAAPLVTVLAQEQLNNQTVYVYGRGDSPLASEDGGGTWRYLTGRDALNSVRQETDAAGQVLAARRFDPYGVPLEGDGGQPFGYAGESWDGDVQMQWLRARWYQPATGRFLSRDPWVGADTRPISYNAWLYAYADPLSLTDPNGRAPTGQDTSNPRDLTHWLFEELDQNANGHYAARIRELLATKRAPEMHVPLDEIHTGIAGLGWTYLVKDRAKWDFKHEIRRRLETTSVLLSDGRSDSWYEYSMPGNVHFGYVGRAAGFSAAALHAGAGFAEVTDRAHVERGEAECKTILICRVCYYFNPQWAETWYDDPVDFQSVEFGVKLYDAYPGNLTLEQFQHFLAAFGWMLQKSAAPSGPVDFNTQDPWPYRVGHFDGPDTQANARILGLLLGGSGD